jgi:hypothetical protein
MGTIGHGYGSEFHLLRYLGYHRRDLNHAIEQLISGRVVGWLDFRFDARKEFPHLDSEWRGLEFLGPDSIVQAAWSKFWPQTGNPPNWDAIGLLQLDWQMEFILVEAKAHIEEVRSDCGAREEGGRNKIRDAFADTIRDHALNASPEQWLTPYYQYANRLATLHFLLKQKVPSRLLFIYFLGDDPHSYGSPVTCPKDEQQWREGCLGDVYRQLGISGGSELEGRVHTLFLPVCGEAIKRPKQSKARAGFAGEGTTWREGAVDRTSEHFELRYGSASTHGWNECTPVALMSRDKDGICIVEFLVERTDPENLYMVNEVVRQLKFFLVELRTPDRPDPWDYLKMHCGTSSNIYAIVHWSFLPGGAAA